MYDTLRPYIIHINHLETLAEICGILRIEMLDEHVQHHGKFSFGRWNQVFAVISRMNTKINFVLIFYLKKLIGNIAGDSLEAFGTICLQLLQDVQERLVFRAHLYLQSDILNYKPSGGDLAYPEKLEMMEVRR